MLKIIDINNENKQDFIDMCKDFYTSNAVSHIIPDANIENTAKEAIAGNQFMRCIIFESNGVVAGYSLLAFTYSNEAGGQVLWLDEIYIKDEFRGNGIGKEFFNWIFKNYDGKIKRYRLEISPENQRVRRLYDRTGFENLPYLQMVIDK